METRKITESLFVIRLGSPSYFNLCSAGKAMIHPQIIDVVSCLTNDGHYVD